ncbi:MAG: haloacid dehalogenase-like hydrolase [Leptospiraceae bacterium]|nr:haloacid dehalogenase-like hydrolase [Leptospiraceae bacterium]
MKSQLTLLILLSLFCAKKEINPEQEILETILNSKKEIEAYKVENQVLCESSKCLFVAFWDFDGTILKGDCSEGLEENGKQVYEGLIELGVTKGYAKDYKGEEGLSGLRKEFARLEKTDIGQAYLFAPKIFAGNDVKTLQSFASGHFKEVLQKYYFPSSVQILNKLKEAGVKSYIISASADFFVKGSVGTIPVDLDSMNGIEMKIENGKTTSTEIPPITFAEGKRKKIELIVGKILQEKKADYVFILAGFGNSFRTDGPFLEYIAEQKLQAGKPISVMINGGNPPDEYKGKFKEVSFDLKK